MDAEKLKSRQCFILISMKLTQSVLLATAALMACACEKEMPVDAASKKNNGRDPDDYGNALVCVR